MARPRRTTTRTQLIALRLTAEERFRLMQKAHKACMTVSEYLRVSALAGRQKVARVQRIIEAPVWPADFYYEVRRIGVNLNQIARQVNTFPDRGESTGVDDVLCEIRDMLARVRDRYGPWP